MMTEERGTLAAVARVTGEDLTALMELELMEGQAPMRTSVNMSSQHGPLHLEMGDTLYVGTSFTLMHYCQQPI